MDAVVSGDLRIQMGKDTVILEAGAEHSAEGVGTQPVVSLDGMRRDICAGLRCC
jgi:hypothetical protein